MCIRDRLHLGFEEVRIDPEFVSVDDREQLFHRLYRAAGAQRQVGDLSIARGEHMRALQIERGFFDPCDRCLDRCVLGAAATERALCLQQVRGGGIDRGGGRFGLCLGGFTLSLLHI